MKKIIDFLKGNVIELFFFTGLSFIWWAMFLISEIVGFLAIGVSFVTVAILIYMKGGE